MQYPLRMQFRLFSLAKQIHVTDAAGASIMHVRQKMLKLREHIEVFRDPSRKEKIFEIRADRVIDFSASYHFTDAEGNDWGAVRRRGARSLWSAHYEIIEGSQVDMEIRELEPWRKVVESLLGEIPVVGFIITLLINPKYVVRRPDGQEVLRVVKKASLFERSFHIEKVSELEPDDELRALLSLIMMTLLERKRG